jgi:glutathione S-transferase
MSGIYKLYGTPTSYYTAKVRSYLIFKKIAYEEIMTTAEVYENVIVKKTGVWMIPVLVSPDGIVLQDSTEIIDFLERRFPDCSVYPETPKQKLATLLLELYGDEWLIMTAIHYRWTKEENRTFAIEEFGRQAKPGCSPAEQQEAGLAKAQVFGGWVDLFGINDVTGPAIEEAYEEMLAALNEHLKDRDYLFGPRPSLADFSFFGGLYAVLRRDPLSGRLMAGLAPRVYDWVERMRNPEVGGDFIAGDEVPGTLMPVLKAIFADQFPVLRDTVRAVNDWLDEHPDEALPKTIGTHDFKLRGRSGNRRIYPYAQWMLQRVLDFYAGVPLSQRADVDEWARTLGGLDHLNLNIDSRIKREDFKLVADPR